MRVVVLGGAGNFGARIVRALQHDTGIELISAGRRAQPRRAVRSRWSPRRSTLRPLISRNAWLPWRLDWSSTASGLSRDRTTRWRRPRSRPARITWILPMAATLSRSFAAHNDSAARGAGRCAISGASTLPALSGAVLDELCAGLQPEDIDICIAPGQTRAAWRSDAGCRAELSRSPGAGLGRRCLAPTHRLDGSAPRAAGIRHPLGGAVRCAGPGVAAAALPAAAQRALPCRAGIRHRALRAVAAGRVAPHGIAVAGGTLGRGLERHGGLARRPGWRVGRHACQRGGTKRGWQAACGVRGC